MTREQLIKKINESGGSVRRIRMRASDLAGFNFSGLDLTGADLSFCNLQKANFDNAILAGANLSFSALSGATFKNADLRNVNLNFSELGKVDLSSANIEGASISFSGRDRNDNAYRPAEEPFTLATLLRQGGFWGILAGVFISTLILYGTSGVIYFTGQIIMASKPCIVRLNQYLIAQNLIAGCVVALVTGFLSPRLDSLRTPVGLRHLLLSIIIVTIWVFQQTVVFLWAGGKEIFEAAAVEYQKMGMKVNDLPWLTYVLGPLIVANLFYYLQRQGRQLTRKLSEQEYQLLNLEKLKTRAELDALQAKINPHFLYNALNSIASLVHENPDRAERMVLLLSKLFRYTTGLKDQYFNTIANELEMVKTYLEVEQVRFGDRLTYRIDLTDETLKHTQIPQFLLQPLVENAIKHGVSRLAGAGGIIVRIRQEDGWLSLSVHDNGPAFPEELVDGYGLRSIQDKLRLLYGENARVLIHNQPLKEIIIQLKPDRRTAQPELFQEEAA